MVFIFYGQINISVGIDCIRPIRTGCVLYQPIIGGRCTLIIDGFGNRLQLVFCGGTTADGRRVRYIPGLIIKTCYIITGSTAGCLAAHGHTAGFHRIRSGYCLHMNVFLEFYADFRIFTGLGDFCRNVIIAVNGDFRA